MPQRTHDCPGFCGRQVPYLLYACSACWRRLPRDLQRPITGNRMGTPEHAEAMLDARRWFREQEPTTPDPTKPSTTNPKEKM